jgi:hypothetical protein
MAGDWIEWCKGLTHKPEILKISTRLHMRPTDAAGSFMLLMEWLDDNIEKFDRHGNAHVTLGPMQSSTFDDLVGVSGFIDAMREAGWVSIKPDELIFINVEKHIGITAKQRALTRRRVQKYRIKFGNDGVTANKLPQNRTEQNSNKRVVAAGKPPPAPADDSSYLEELKRNPAYQGIDIDRERGKAEAWCAANRRVCSRRFFVNWLNKCEQPLGTTGKPKREIPPEPLNWRGIIRDHYPDAIYLQDERDWAHLPEYTREAILETLKKIPA